MKHKLGNLIIVLGFALITAALVLFLSNQQEQIKAADSSREAIAKVAEVIMEKKQDPDSGADAVLLPAATIPVVRPMTETIIDGHGYIGFLGIASLDLELPVMTDWTYPQLQIAPCRYFGSTFTDNLVIMAHNYPKHFGKIRDMQTGDVVTFTDMDGNTIEYEVIALDIMAATAVADMTSGDYDLTLFTCNYGGTSRVAVHCDRV